MRDDITAPSEDGPPTAFGRPGRGEPPDAAEKASRPTPMMEQYIEIKAANPDCLLFYRMGDFFELFFEDAEQASRTLGIALTKRGKHLGADIPMCGVPVDRADDYLQRLIAAGHRVAVCEQLEDPAEARKRGGRSVVRRDVVRLVTAGTITEDALLNPRRSNLLLAVVRVRTGERQECFGLAWTDLSTGLFTVGESDRAHLGAEIARLDPAEIVMGEALCADPQLQPIWENAPGVIAGLGRDAVDSATAEPRLCRAFGVATSEGFGQLSRAELTAAAAIVAYIERTQLGSKAHLARPARAIAGALLEIDSATRASLELTRSLSGHDSGSLLAAIDRTATAPGARLLAERLAGPLTDPDAIALRLGAIAALLQDERLRSKLRATLAQAPDLARAVQRLVVGRGGPRDLACVRDALRAGEKIGELLGGATLPLSELTDAQRALAYLDGDTLREAIGAVLADDLPTQRRDGGFVRSGFDAGLDEARALRDESRKIIAALQQRYVEATQLRGLRIKHNNLIGFFVEVPQAAGDGLRAAPFNETFVHRQTMAGAMRFSTAELVELEQKIAEAGDRAIAIEHALFDRLAASVAERADAMLAIAAALALVDVAAGLAELAAEARWTRPEVDRGLELCITGGRHPVVEAALRASGQPFVANGVDLSPAAADEPGRIWLITGPNMAGKSTFLRQTALIVVLAQMGSYVPAAAARIGVVDRLFSRVGAADDLARGRSTFMVEMVEAAAILNQATRRSFVILDEIGRGTATFDGLSIAWATIEHLHEVNRCRGLFATHFHELAALVKRLHRLANATIKVAEYNGEVVLLHEIVPGTADRSYGIQVAKLAGLPSSVVKRARKILAELEEADRTSPVERLIDDLPLFAAAREKSAMPQADPLGAALDAIDPDELTPKGALAELYRLKALRTAG